MQPVKSLLAICFALTLAACSAPEGNDGAEATDGGVINVYSTRHYDSDRILYKAFEDKTGIRVRFREGQSAGLLEAMKAEGASSPADVVIATDAGTLWRFQDAGLLQPTRSAHLENTIPAKFREPAGHWFGLSKRARIIVYDPARHAPEDISGYDALSSPALRGEVCMRSSSNIYNLSLMSELIERWGDSSAQVWATDVVANFARDPSGGDTTQVQSIAAGECSVALINHYYWVRLATSNSANDRAAAEATALLFPATETGTHVNITGAGIAANAPNSVAALAFIEFLTTPEGQSLLVQETKEFPMVDSAELPEGLDVLPDFKASDTPLTIYGENQARAQATYDRAGWK